MPIKKVDTDTKVDTNVDTDVGTDILETNRVLFAYGPGLVYYIVDLLGMHTDAQLGGKYS